MFDQMNTNPKTSALLGHGSLKTRPLEMMIAWHTKQVEKTHAKERRKNKILNALLPL